jgi:NADPH:quinone reductase-like Zn-dependent oxidoreductase
MKAVVLTGYGDIDRLEVRTLPDPHAERGAILVRVTAASINPVDWKMRSGAARARYPMTFPAVLGRDAAGEVVEVGENVTQFRVGDRVLGLVNKAYAELVTAPVACWAKVPEGLDLREAGALPLVLLTGAQLIEEAVAPERGDRVLVTGAVGSVGRVAVFAAMQEGAEVWAGVHAEQRAEAEKLGADGVVAIDDAADVAKLPELDAIADTVGGETIERLLPKVRHGGVLGSVVGAPAAANGSGLTVHAIMARPDSRTLARYAAAVAEQKLAIPIARQVPLATAADAQAFAEREHPQGKVLLLVN